MQLKNLADLQIGDKLIRQSNNEIVELTDIIKSGDTKTTYYYFVGFSVDRKCMGKFFKSNKDNIYFVS